MVGLFVAISWGAGTLVEKWKLHRGVPAVFAGLTLSALMLCAFSQVRYWKDSTTLFQHTLDVTSNNYYIHRNMGGGVDGPREVGRGDSSLSRGLED